MEKDIKEIGKVIRVTETDEENCFHVHHEIEMDDKKYEIVPLAVGDYVKIPGICESEGEKIKSEIREGILKEVEKYIEYRVIRNEIAGTVGIRADLCIIAKKKESEEA